MPPLDIEEEDIKSVWGIDFRKFPGEWIWILHVTLNTKGYMLRVGKVGFEKSVIEEEDTLYMVTARMLHSYVTIITFKP